MNAESAKSPRSTNAQPPGIDGGLTPQDKMQILYEIAISIGVALDAEAMFTTALSAFVRQLNCAAGAIYFRRPHAFSEQPIAAIPRNLHHNMAAAMVDSLAVGTLDDARWQAFLATLPRREQPSSACFAYLFALGDLGLLSLVKYDCPIDTELEQMLRPLLIKLTEAGRACLQQEELTAVHRNILWERNMLRSLIDATPSVLFSLDAEGRFLFSEGRGLEAIGRRPGEVVGQSIFELYAGNPDILDKVRAALQGETIFGTVETLGRAYDVVYRPVVDKDGCTHGIVGAAYDVTERKAAIDTLTAVLNSVDEGIVTTDARGVIQMINAQVTNMFGYDQEALLGQPIWMLLSSGHQPDMTIADMQEFIRINQLEAPGFFLDLEGRKHNGRTFPIEMRVQSFMLGDQPRYTVSIRDVTERKEYDRLRDDFVSTVSHELRTPLASIMGWTETLLTEHPGPLNDLQKRFLNTVYASAVRLDKLIDEVLTVSRIQRGVLRLNRSRIEPSLLLADAQKALAPQIAARNIQLQIEDTWPSEQTLEGDAERLAQVVKELLTNAIKFSPNGGEVIVRSWLDGNAWRLEIEDHGVGIEEEELPLVFQRFYRGQAARKAQIQGAGLGLYVCKAIVEGHQGKITLESQPGVHTVARFWIPIKVIPEGD